MMRDVIWIYAAIIAFLSKAWSQDPGTNLNTSVNYNTSSHSPAVYVVRNSSFKMGHDAKLDCSDKTWNETMFVIWNIKLKYKQCRISFSNEGQSEDSCSDGKTLRNTSSAQSYLHIPNFSDADVGVYKCESVYIGGLESYETNVDIIVPPSISSWIEHKDNKTVAVCKAEGGKPAANIRWSHMANSSPVERVSHGFFTVEIRLELHEGMDTENLSCVIRHPYWNKENILVPQPEKGNGPWLYILIVAAISAILLLVVFLIFTPKKLIMLGRCQQSDTSLSKSTPIEDVEEVEPYASYVQRVNSIYNSSADLFT
ncbi:cell surface glycoprotein CD200 receptor 1 isoform X2 [Pempheris klunzingeri]|uniref:cell surface glycoprotein CD200 receptor 1 isoform X2 n=1 Tax=Pempheris klunzingeri TaxID=3127111 RepID=UPI003980F80A